MKSNLLVMTLGFALFSANAVHAQTQPTSPHAPEAAPGGPLPSVASPQPVYGPAEQPESRQWRATNEGKFMFGGSWDIGIPVGSAQSFTGNASAVGFELLGQYWLTSHVTVGASLDWQTYWDTRPRQTYAVDNGAITATADNSIRGGASRAIARYFFLDQGVALPYAGLNIGLGWSTFQTAASAISLYDNALSVLLGAEIGALLVLEPDMPMITVGARYTALPAADFLAVTNVQSITFQLGLMMP
jgi:hypothetical protein